MKTQAWGWLAAGVLAAGLNASYHDGGLEWAHRVAGRVVHNSAAVLALASGQADRFLAEARVVAAQSGTASCPLTNALARVQTAMAQSENGFDHVQVISDRMQMISDREQARLDRLEAQRARMAARFAAQSARFQVNTADFNFTDFAPAKVWACPRVRVKVVRIPAPVVHVELPGAGPV